MGDWLEHFLELKQQGAFTDEDYKELRKQVSQWAAHLAIAQEDPRTTTRYRIFERAHRLQNKIGR